MSWHHLQGGSTGSPANNKWPGKVLSLPPAPWTPLFCQGTTGHPVALAKESPPQQATWPRKHFLLCRHKTPLSHAEPLGWPRSAGKKTPTQQAAQPRKSLCPCTQSCLLTEMHSAAWPRAFVSQDALTGTSGRNSGTG